MTKENRSNQIEVLMIAARQGNSLAQYQLGLCYEFGYGVPKDFKKATPWFKKAAAQGHARAKLILELRLFVRLGMAEDYTGVIKWFKNIAERKQNDAECLSTKNNV